MATFTDTFNRANGALGAPWSALTGGAIGTGGVAVNSNRAVPTGGNVGSASVVDLGLGGGDCDVYVETGTSGGYALYFRVVDANNFWRFSVNYYPVSTQTGGGYNESYTIFQSTCLYDGGDGGQYLFESESGYPGCPPPSTYNSTVVSRTDSTRTGTRYIEPTYSTTFHYQVLLERYINGTRVLAASPGTGQVSSLRVLAQGTRIRAYVNGSGSPVADITDGTHSTASKVGVGQSVFTTYFGSDGVDNFSAATFNVAPNAPSLIAPVGGVVLDRTQAQRFSWSFSDNDPGDTQSAYTLQYRVAGSGAAWAQVTGGAVQFHDFAANTFAAGNYEWQVLTRDATGASGPYSTSGLFTASTPPPGPTITAPTNNSTVTNAGPINLTWSQADQDAYEVRKLADLAGSPDTATVLYSSGVQESANRFAPVSYPVNLRTEHVQVRTRFGGLWSPWSSVKVTVSYTPPEAARVTLLAGVPDDGAIRVTYRHDPNILSESQSDFETTTSPVWSSDGTTTVQRVQAPNPVLTGLWSLRVNTPSGVAETGTATTTTGVEATLTVEPGVEYIARLGVYVDAGGAGFAQRLKVSGAPLAAPVYSDPATAQAWTILAVRFLALTSGTVTLRLVPQVAPTVTGRTFIDSAAVRRYDPTAPAPAAWSPGGSPVGTSLDLYRRRLGVTSEEVRIAAGLPVRGEFLDRTPGSATPYEYRTTVTGANGTATASEWTP